MKKTATTKMSSKGQVVIPEEIRERLGFEPGEQFVVVGADDMIILKAVSPPSMADFDDIIAEARKQARAAAMKRVDIAKVLKDVRAGR